MADVDLSVDVTSVGIPKAIQQIEDLREKGLSTAAAMNKLSQESVKAATTIASLSRAQRGTSASMTAATEAIATQKAALKSLEAEYRTVASLNVGMSPAERLANQFGSLNAGKTAAAAIRAQREAFNADPVRDLMAVERQEQQLLDARNQKLAAQGNLARAKWEREISDLTRTEQAQKRLVRAQEEELAAKARLATLPRSGLQGPAYIEAQARAQNEYARAIDATQRAQAALATHSEGDVFPAFRYLILAGLATQAARAIFGVEQAAVQASMAVERAFADVERTFEGTATELGALRSRLVELSTSTPISFVDLSEIATLGNQLGVASADIESFTRIIAQYTAVSGESAETAATAFGRISNLTGLAASQYSNLASAITYVARTTVATESTIQNTAKEISALSAGAGFSAQAIVGLAGALSSLAIPPERARGALSLYFGALNEAVAEGGPKLAAFAELTNLTVDQLDAMVRQNKGQEVFTAFIQGLSQLDTVAKTTALDTLGLSTIRVDQTMRALAQNVPLVTQAFNGAETAFRENTEIANQYAIIQETLNSKWIEFQNAVTNVAAALGDALIPYLKDALIAATDLLVGVQKFAHTPLGEAFIRIAAGAATLIATMAAVVGAVSLAKAGIAVLGFAIQGLGWTAATKGLAGWIAALVTTSGASRAAAVNTTTFRVALSETVGTMSAATVGARALSVAMGLLTRVVLPLLAITAAVSLFTELSSSIDKAINPSKRLTDDISGLKDALIADNRDVGLDRQIQDLSGAAKTTRPEVSAFNQSILAAISAQQQAQAALDGTTSSLDAQSFALGDASKAWIADALKQSDALADIIDGDDFWGRFWGQFSPNPDVDQFVTQDDFKQMILGGLDVNEIAQIAIEDGTDAALKVYNSWLEGYIKANPSEKDPATSFGILLETDILPSVTDAFGDAAVEAALAGGKISETGAVAVATAGDFDQLGNYIGTAMESGEALAVTFSGVTGELDAFRDAIQGAFDGTVGFDSVLKRAIAANEAYADAMDLDTPPPVDAAGFGAALKSATTEAITFYDGIMKLAAGGNQSFALQLAQLGPEAAPILSSALSDPAGLAGLEEASRFAAFLASDAFKKTLDAEMANSNEAYARIFQTTGDLADVKDYIAAQVAGTGAEWERKWDINHPNLPLNVTPELVNPTDEDIAIWSQFNSGRITIKPVFEKFALPGGGSESVQTGSTYTDTLTGASITLPASLDQGALTASLTEWQAGQKASPEDIAAKLNTAGFNKDIDDWIAINGPITIYARVVPTNNVADQLTADGRPKRYGGLINAYADGGRIRGSGSGTDDRVPLWASPGEYIMQNSSRRFWGQSFFDSLNRNMLPTSFVNMLGAAATAGNGPSHVAHVQLTQVNPISRDPLKVLREKSEMLAQGIWGDD